MAETVLSVRKGRSCTNCIFSLYQLIESKIGCNVRTYVDFMDYIKAFDRVIGTELRGGEASRSTMFDPATVCMQRRGFKLNPSELTGT
jgi:hypothetical protein